MCLKSTVRVIKDIRSDREKRCLASTSHKKPFTGKEFFHIYVNSVTF